MPCDSCLQGPGKSRDDERSEVSPWHGPRCMFGSQGGEGLCSQRQ